MVCRECGAYNPEHLSHCRVCAARLRDTEPEENAAAYQRQPADNNASETAEQEDGHPAREFVRAPSWPTRPYTGAPEKKTFAPPPQDDASETEDADMLQPSASDAPPRPAPARAPVRPESRVAAPAASSVPAAPRAAAVKASAAPARVCSVCGRPMLPDAPFCAYCGSHEGLPGGESPRPSVRRSEKASVLNDEAAAVSPAVPARAAVRRPARELPDYDDEDEEETRVPSKKAGKSKKHEEEAFEDEGYDNEDYDDEDYDEDYDDEDMPRKKSKGTTILFWVLIVLLVALIAVFGMYMLRNKGAMGGSGFLSSIFGGGDDTQEPAADQTADASDTGDAALSAEAASKMYTCTVSSDVDTEGNPVFLFKVYAPTGSTVSISTPTELMNGGQATVSKNDLIILSIPQTAFLPGTPCDTAAYTATPIITVTTPEGETVPLEVPEVSLEIPTLILTVNEPATDSVTAAYGNAPITISGQVEDRGVEVYVNGAQCTVYDAGIFEYQYQPAGGDAPETVYVEAKKNNYVTAVHSFTIEPYVVQNMSLLPTNDASIETRGLLATKENSYTVVIEGTITPGATLTATCTDTTNIVFGTPSVSEAGSFQYPVTVNAMGAFQINLTATLEGYNDGVATVYVERTPTESSSTFKKGCTALKTEGYEKIVAGTTTSGSFSFTGTITEVISSTPYEIVRMTLSTGEEIIVTNRGKSRFGADDVNKKKTIAGVLVGFYPETTTPHIWGWFAWNAN